MSIEIEKKFLFKKEFFNEVTAGLKPTEITQTYLKKFPTELKESTEFMHILKQHYEEHPEEKENFKSIIANCFLAPEKQTLHPELRVRAKDEKNFCVTIKLPKSTDGLSRQEFEFDISKEMYNLFLTQKKGNTIKKNRYKVPGENNLIYEIDIYQGVLKGLATVEVEFPNEEIANAFQKPEYFGKNVTSDKSYKNAQLAEHGIPSGPDFV